MSSYEIPDEYWEEDHDSELPLDHRYWRPSPPNTVDYENVDDDGMPLVEHAFEEGAVSITINQLLSAHRAREDSVREARHAATDAHLESGEFRLHRPPDEDTHVPIPRGAFAEVSALEYNFVHGYVLRGSALFWEPLLPDWRRLHLQHPAPGAGDAVARQLLVERREEFGCFLVFHLPLYSRGGYGG